MSKEHAYAYEAGYRDGSINYELEHCPACKNVADLQEALAENAKLRSQCADLVDERERLFRTNVEKNGEILRLVDENTKLRELVRWMYYLMESCAVQHPYAPAPISYDRLLQAQARACELGIEVTE